MRCCDQLAPRGDHEIRGIRTTWHRRYSRTFDARAMPKKTRMSNVMLTTSTEPSECVIMVQLPLRLPQIRVDSATANDARMSRSRREDPQQSAWLSNAESTAQLCVEYGPAQQTNQPFPSTRASPKISIRRRLYACRNTAVAKMIQEVNHQQMCRGLDDCQPSCSQPMSGSPIVGSKVGETLY